jgi:hypothetical protein
LSAELVRQKLSRRLDLPLVSVDWIASYADSRVYAKNRVIDLRHGYLDLAFNYPDLASNRTDTRIRYCT